MSVLSAIRNFRPGFLETSGMPVIRPERRVPENIAECIGDMATTEMAGLPDDEAREWRKLEPAASAYEVSRLKDEACGSGHFRWSRRAIRPLIRQNEQNRHTFFRVIRHHDG